MNLKDLVMAQHGDEIACERISHSVKLFGPPSFYLLPNDYAETKSISYSEVTIAFLQNIVDSIWEYS